MRLGLFPLNRALWQRLVRAGFRFWQSHRHQPLALEHVAKHPLLVLPQVFNPRLFRTGAFLGESLNQTLIPSGATVLDVGTGSGVGAICAARWARHVVAVDINPEAVRCARINALLNRVEDRVQVHKGDLFAPIGEQRFDVILSNPPFFRGQPDTMAERAFWAEDIEGRFAAGCSAHLASGGHALIVLSSHGETDAFLDAFRAEGLEGEIVRERHLFGETVWMYRLTKGEPC